MKTIDSGLGPRAARLVAAEHNRKCHGGKCVAFVAVTRMAKHRRWKSGPDYDVRCLVCPPEETGGLVIPE